MADIVFVLSGGTENLDPSSSIGGAPSASPLTADPNNLFSDVSGDVIDVGLIDYRCIYIFNDNTDRSFRDVKVWIESQEDTDSTVVIGIKAANQKQQLSFVNVQSGTFKLNVDGHTTAAITYVFNTAVLASNIQARLRGLPNSTAVVVTPVDSATYGVEWLAPDHNKKYPLMIVTDSTLTPDNPASPPSLTVSETQAGSPINAITVDIGDAKTPPTGVVFSSPSADSPLSVGTLKPTEGFALWVRRTTIPDAKAAASGFKLKLTGIKAA